MNRHTTYLLLALLLLTAFTAYGKKKSEIRLIQNLCEYRNDTLYIGINVDLGKMNISPRQSVVITPVLMSENGTANLPSIIINGKGRERLYKRSQSFRKEYASAGNHDLIINQNRKAEEEIYYLATLPRQEWMDRASLYINEERYGCSSKEQLILIERLDMPAPPPISPEKSIASSPVTEKPEEISKTVDIRFEINQYDVNTGLNDNRQKFETIDSLIKMANAKELVIKKITLTGYASVEGPYKFNWGLSRNRAMSLRDYMQGIYHLPGSVFQLIWKGEDWEGLDKAVSASSMPGRDRVLEIIHNVPPQDRDTEISRLNNGKTLQYMEKHILPPLRRVIVNFEFTVSPGNGDSNK